MTEAAGSSGIAPPDDVMASSIANVQRISPALVLGSVLAHEIGHALLKHGGHSAEGLMRAPWNANDWQRAALGLLLFSGAETAAIRATISSCGDEP